jgi:hypothetical protein
MALLFVSQKIFRMLSVSCPKSDDRAGLICDAVFIVRDEAFLGDQPCLCLMVSLPAPYLHAKLGV